MAAMALWGAISTILWLISVPTKSNWEYWWVPFM